MFLFRGHAAEWNAWALTIKFLWLKIFEISIWILSRLMRAATQLGIKGAGQGLKIPQLGTFAFLWETTMRTRRGVLLRERERVRTILFWQHCNMADRFGCGQAHLKRVNSRWWRGVQEGAGGGEQYGVKCIGREFARERALSKFLCENFLPSVVKCKSKAITKCQASQATRWQP